MMFCYAYPHSMRRGAYTAKGTRRSLTRYAKPKAKHTNHDAIVLHAHAHALVLFKFVFMFMLAGD